MKKFFLTLIIIILAATLAVSFFYFGFDRMFNRFEHTGAEFPRLANYYLKWDLTAEDVAQLARWDLVVLAPQAEERRPGLLKELKNLNPQLQIFVYQLVQESSPNYTELQDGTYAKEIFKTLEENDWWLKDTNGERVSIWPGHDIINITNETKWVNFITDFVTNEYFAKHPEYDGVFYDNVWFDISWIQDVEVDLDSDGVSDDNALGDGKWRLGTKDVLSVTRAKNPNKLVLGNVNFAFFNNFVNGKMFENFGRNQKYNWRELMYEYWNSNFKLQPNIIIVNENPNNLNDQTNVRQARFGLTSTLLSDGYYSYDQGDCCHDSLWWYDEYNLELGKATSLAQRGYQLGPLTIWLAKDPDLGIWRRNFEKGTVYVNSTDGDITINIGLNRVTVPAQDGLILQNK